MAEFPNLAPIRDFYETLMIDGVRIVEYGDGIAAESFENGKWYIEDASPTVIYSGDLNGGGPCLFGSPTSEIDPTKDHGEAPAAEQRFRLSVPLSAPLLDRLGLIATITHCERDPEQVGRAFRILSIGGGTFKLGRRLQMVEWRPTTTGDPSHALP